MKPTGASTSASRLVHGAIGAGATTLERPKSCLPTVLPSATPKIIPRKVMNAALSRAVPERRCRVDSSVRPTVSVSPGTSAIRPASVAVKTE